MPLLLLLRFAWPWGVILALLAAIGVEHLIAKSARASLAESKALLVMREAEKISLEAAIAAQNAKVRELEEAAAAATREAATRVETVIVTRKATLAELRKTNPKNAKELNQWVASEFSGF